MHYIHVQVYWIITFAPRARDDPLKNAAPARIPQGFKQKTNQNLLLMTNGTLTRCHTLYDLRSEVNFHLHNRSEDHSNKHPMINYTYIVIFKHNILQTRCQFHNEKNLLRVLQ